MRIALFIYCLVGALILVAAITLASFSAYRLDISYKKAYVDMESAAQDSTAKQQLLAQMQEAQRRDRALYTPQQAVQASFAVQEAQDAAQQAAERQNKATAEETRLKAERDRYLVALIPLGVFLFGHLLLAVMLRPRRGGTQPAWKRE
jgi:hypothetical protein